MKARLFALTFLSLFLELMVIRWAPSMVKLVSYYANLLLISSFLGLGLGSIRARPETAWFRHFPFGILAFVLFLYGAHHFPAPGTGTEYRIYATAAGPLAYASLIGLFVMNALMFIPLGEGIARCFRALPPQSAYGWDLAGGLAGSVIFGLFSYYWFSPFMGLVAVMGLFIVLADRRDRPRSAAVLCLCAGLVFLTAPKGAVWSPYYYINVVEYRDGRTVHVTEPVADLQRRQDPPFYTVRVNNDFIEVHGTLDSSRYSDRRSVDYLRNHYLLPYQMGIHPQSVLVLGAGGGIDVEAALLSGARTVDAVDIDPAMFRLGRRFNASGVYDDPRVRSHAEDARAYLERHDDTYDAVVYGLLDSQSLFSSMSSVRLDGFVYTVEGLRRAFSRVKEGGFLAVSFSIGHTTWLEPKMTAMLQQATGQLPVVYSSGYHRVFGVSKNGAWQLPAKIGRFERLTPALSEVEPATDDWPYLYLVGRNIPRDYLLVIGTLLLLCLGVLRQGAGVSMERRHRQAMGLGAGFLLLQVKSIVSASLFIGPVWMVTTLVVIGVFLMALLSNAVAGRIRLSLWWLYAFLLAAVIVIGQFPAQIILSWPWSGRVAWVVLAMPIPLFFAGLLFARLLRESTAAEAPGVLGANLIGATLGGFAEYCGMVGGIPVLTALTVVAYAAAGLNVGRRMSFSLSRPLVRKSAV